MPDNNSHPIAFTKLPVFINPKSGSAAHLLPYLHQHTGLDVHEVSPQQLTEQLRLEIAKATPRVLIAGGDGTLGLAASVLVGTNTAMAVLAGGTLNHFIGNLGLPTQVEAAVELALNSPNIMQVDVGYVNDRLFLNTSSVGAYVRFVRTREHLERYMNYYMASMIAGIRRLVRLHSARLYLNGVKLRSPLAFIGVRERELSYPVLGQTVDHGQHGLHVIVVRTKNRWEMLKLSFHAIFRGISPLEKAKQVENRIVDSITIDNHYRKQGIYVALDGEIALLQTPLHYRYARDVLKVVVA
jgi:diacylglycerol kinase family enzyme